MLKGSSSAVHLSSQSSIIGKSKSGSTYSRAFDRLYYEHPNAGRYGKISGLISGVLASVAEPIFFDAEPKKEDKLPKAKKIGRKDLIEMKREIFLTKLSMDNKQKSLADLGKFVGMQESDLEHKKKLAVESKNLYMKFLDTEGKKVKELQEQHANYEVELQNQRDNLDKIQREIKDMEYALKRVKDDIEEAKGFEAFIEMVAEGWYNEQVTEIKTHNENIHRIVTVNQLESQRQLQLSPTKPKKRYNLGSSRKDTKVSGQSSGFLLTQPDAPKSVVRSLSRLEDADSSHVDPEDDLRFFTEIFQTPEEFVLLLRKIEEDCLNSIQTLSLLDEELAGLEKQVVNTETELRKDMQPLIRDLKEAQEKRALLKVQVETRKSKLSLGTADLSDLSPADQLKIYKKIPRLDQDLNPEVVKNKHIPQQVPTFASALLILQTMTKQAEGWEEEREHFKQEYKREYEVAGRWLAHNKREKAKLIEEAEQEQERAEKLAEKEVREAETLIKLKGRREMTRVWAFQKKGRQDIIDEEAREAQRVRMEEFKYYGVGTGD